MKKISFLFLIIFILAMPSCTEDENKDTDPNANELKNEFIKKQFIHDETKADFPYSFYVPKQAEETNEKFPLIIALHGTEYLFKFEEEFLTDEASGYFAHAWIEKQNQEKHPAYVAAPNLHTKLWNAHDSYIDGWTTSIVEGLLNHILSTNNQIDTDRIYLVGQSMGGASVWIIGAEMKKQLAAIISFAQSFSASNLEFQEVLQQINNDDFKELAIWDFTHKKDNVGGAITSRMMFEVIGEKSYADPVLTNWYGNIHYNLSDMEIQEKITSGNKFFYTEYDYECNQESSMGKNSECHYVVTHALKNDFVFEWLFKQNLANNKNMKSLCTD